MLPETQAKLRIVLAVTVALAVLLVGGGGFLAERRLSDGPSEQRFVRDDGERTYRLSPMPRSEILPIF